jgi:hypothetical protein
MAASPKPVDPNDLALRILASRGTSAYLAGLVHPGESASLAAEVEAELRALDEHVAVGSLIPSSGAARLLHELPSITADVLLIGAESYGEEDWRLLDRRRSALARTGVMVFFTTPPSFTMLMRVAPNLSSWLAGLVFSAGMEHPMTEEQREARLARLRAWAGMTDAEVALAATEGHLPGDPEYAEWLVLIGRGDLLDAR